MDADVKYLILSSKHAYQGTPNNFYIFLQDPLELEPNSWTCTVTQLSHPGVANDIQVKTNLLLLCCNLITSSYVAGSGYLPVLDTFNLDQLKGLTTQRDSGIFELPLVKHRIDSIHLYLHDGEKPVNIFQDHIHVILKLTKKS
jgi:hypothetical protein